MSIFRKHKECETSIEADLAVLSAEIDGLADRLDYLEEAFRDLVRLVDHMNNRIREAAFKAGP